MRCGRTILAAAVALAVQGVAVAYANSWDVDIVYSGGFAAGDTSLAIDSSGAPSVSYTANGTLYVSTRSVSGWTGSPVAPVGYFGGWSSLAFNAAGQPSVAYIDTSNPAYSYVKYAYKPSASWTVETAVVDDVGWNADYVALAYNPVGQACVAYCKTVTLPDYSMHSYICFRRRTAANTWTAVETILEVGYVTGPSMVIGSSEYVTFAESTSGQLKFASRSGTNPWQVQGLDGSAQSPVVGYTSAALQSNGSPAIAYFKSDSGAVNLRFAWKSGTTWNLETVKSLPGSSQYHCSLAVSQGGIPMIVYYAPASETCIHAWKSGGVWHSETVDSAAGSGLRPRLKLDTYGNASASYFDSYNYNVKFASVLIPRTMAEVKTAPDGQTVRIPGLVASTNRGEAPNRIYVQEAARTSGIGLYFPTSVPAVTRGMVLDVEGPLTTLGGERALNDPDVIQIGSETEARPLGMSNQAVGGGGFYYCSGPPPLGQRGVLGGVGTNNIGLLVRAWGRYTYVNSTTFEVDDGSGLNIRCVLPSGVGLNSTWLYVAVSGISSCEQVGSDLSRLIRVRSLDDIAPF